eukprot:m.891453 g.891453  ORF g.891453 m.891453 type:complete len:101 (-) comp59965_c0_seq3:3324-3626(-)
MLTLSHSHLQQPRSERSTRACVRAQWGVRALSPNQKYTVRSCSLRTLTSILRLIIAVVSPQTHKGSILQMAGACVCESPCTLFPHTAVDPRPILSRADHL